jgi:DNA-directed RNA polymerase subunit alpha
MGGIPTRKSGFTNNNMEQILLPSTIEFIDGDQPNCGQVIVTPCHQGYGTTLGNALRRVLLSSLPGAAVESVKINGTQHEFSAIDGIAEDVVEILLNLKQLAVRCYSDSPITLTLHKKGKGDVFAKDFDKNSDVEIANPDLKILTLTDDKKNLDLEVTVGKGRGYVPVEEKKGDRNLDLGTILIDSLYTPIRDVGYKVELTRVGDVTDYEKLVLNIETNGTITPREAVNQATRILMDHLALVLEASDSLEPERVLPETSNTSVEETEVSSEVEEEKTTKTKKAVKKNKK